MYLVLAARTLATVRCAAPETVALKKPFFETGKKCDYFFMNVVINIILSSVSLSTTTIGSDVWSFGCLMFELLSWRAPFSELREPTPIVAALRSGRRPNLAAHIIPRYKSKRLVAFFSIFAVSRCASSDQLLSFRWLNRVFDRCQSLSLSLVIETVLVLLFLSLLFRWRACFATVNCKKKKKRNLQTVESTPFFDNQR
jgi:serine/threonine protein kinase